MPNIKVLREPGFVCDLNYLFFLKFNTNLCIENLPNDAKKEADVASLTEILSHFGEISDDLYLFYHAKGDARCFVTTHYVDAYKDMFANGFDFKFFKNELFDTDSVIRKLARFYISDISDEELEECLSSTPKLFDKIKRSNCTADEKIKLYEFFIDPARYIQTLQRELIEKEFLLSAYYKENYAKIIEAHNNTTVELLSTPIKGTKDFSILSDESKVLYTSYSLLNKFFMKLFFTPEGIVYLLGYDYISALNEVKEKNTLPPIEKLCAALGEDSRVRILDLLLEKGELTCKDFERTFNFSGSTAYHHITILVKSGAVKIRNEGKSIYYSINRKHFDTMIEALKKYSTV